MNTVESYESWNQVPKGYREALRFFVSIREPGAGVTRVWCHDYAAAATGCPITLWGAVIDTSQRYQGITLKTEFSYIEECTFGSAFWIARPLTEREIEQAPQRAVRVRFIPILINPKSGARPRGVQFGRQSVN